MKKALFGIIFSEAVSGIEMKVISRNTAVVCFDCHRSNSSNIISCYHIVQSNILFCTENTCFQCSCQLFLLGKNMLPVDILVLKQPFLRANRHWPYYCSLLFIMLPL